MGQRLCSCDDECSTEIRGSQFEKPKLPPSSAGLTDDLLLAEVHELRAAMTAKDSRIQHLERELSAKALLLPSGQISVRSERLSGGDAGGNCDQRADPLPVPEPMPAHRNRHEVGPAKSTRDSASGILTLEVALSAEAAGGALALGLESIPASDGGSTLLITEVDDARTCTAVGFWNARQRELGQAEAAVGRGDRVVSVNSVAGDVQAMLGLLARRGSSAVNLVVERWPDVVIARLRKSSPEERYGMQMELVQKGSGDRILRITRISQDGLLGEWNRSAAAAGRFHEVVAAASEIVQAGQETDPEVMQDAIGTADGAEIHFRRPDPSVLKGLLLQQPPAPAPKSARKGPEVDLPTSEESDGDPTGWAP